MTDDDAGKDEKRDPVTILAQTLADMKIDWGMWSTTAAVDPEHRYEVRVFGDSPLRFIERGASPNMAVRAALVRLAQESST